MQGIIIKLPSVVANQLPGVELTAEDADRLATHGVNPDLADAAGLRRIGSDLGARILGRPHHGDLSGILIPYIDPQKPVVNHHRLWLDDALLGRASDQVPTEFLQRTGSTGATPANRTTATDTVPALGLC